MSENLRKLITERIHIQPIQKTRKTLTETRKTTVHLLQLFEIGVQVGESIRKFRKRGLKRVEREEVVGLTVFGEGAAGDASEWGCWAVTTVGRRVGLTV